MEFLFMLSFSKVRSWVGVDVMFAHLLSDSSCPSFIFSLLNMQTIKSACTSCNHPQGDVKNRPGEECNRWQRVITVPLDKCVPVCEMLIWIITPPLTSGPGCLRRCCKSSFLQTKHNLCGGGRWNGFCFVDLSHSTDYVPLHLRCLHSAHSSSHTDYMEPVQFYSLTYNTMLSQFTAAQ